ncbi:uncharacterized protein LOC135097464 isoform X2 [Scylla paramamosain]|uniref:uncharacterized protein LOC135097464 isoform X2 n=1 Tax=Scylla paramamosain TaxID=85552 RepID=UPI003082F742
MKQCPMLIPTLLCCRGVSVLQAELCSKKSYKTSSSTEIVKVPGTCFVQPAAPSPARPCLDESAVGFPVLERELPSQSGHLKYSLEANMTTPQVTKVWQSCKCCVRQHPQHDQLHSSVCCLIWRPPPAWI